MYGIIRFILIITVLLVTYLAALMLYFVPWAWLVTIVVGIVMLCKKTYHFTAYGTARWAKASDIPDMIERNWNVDK